MTTEYPQDIYLQKQILETLREGSDEGLTYAEIANKVQTYHLLRDDALGQLQDLGKVEVLSDPEDEPIYRLAERR